MNSRLTILVTTCIVLAQGAALAQDATFELLPRRGKGAVKVLGIPGKDVTPKSDDKQNSSPRRRTGSRSRAMFELVQPPADGPAKRPGEPRKSESVFELLPRSKDGLNLLRRQTGGSGSTERLRRQVKELTAEIRELRRMMHRLERRLARDQGGRRR